MKINQIPPGQVFFQRTKKYGLTAFVKIEDKVNHIICSDCGSGVWNVNNFKCDVHFCINRDFNLEIADWTAKKN